VKREPEPVLEQPFFGTLCLFIRIPSLSALSFERSRTSIWQCFTLLRKFLARVMKTYMESHVYSLHDLAAPLARNKRMSK
jgi:hypothetical protein